MPCESATRGEEGATRDARVLVVDDSQGVRSYLAELLEKDGWSVDTAESGRCALHLLDAGANPDLVLLGLSSEGRKTLAALRRLHADVPVVVMSVEADAGTIVEVMRLGASDYLTKPFDEGALAGILARLFERRRGDRPSAPPAEATDGPIVWRGAAMQRIRAMIDQVSDTDVTVLIQGESGVGKEIVARRVHDRSRRTAKPFVKVNCAALPSDLLESELFGYETGAFTGANARKPGRFERADKGTIFLDEIGEMSPKLQAKLLQVLQDGEFTRLGGNREVRVDVRVVCATNRALKEMVAAGEFREDLYFRLNVVAIDIPPLRERRDEILPLVETFLQRYSTKYGKAWKPISPELSSAFEGHGFPGNVRELENLVKRLVILQSENLVFADLGVLTGTSSGSYRLMQVIKSVEESAGEISLREVARKVSLEAERDAIDRVLRRTGWNRKQAAKFLNVSYKTLLQKIRECGLQPDA